jgi:hypothetical protein
MRFEFPAVNRRAIVGYPSGTQNMERTDKSRELSQLEVAPEGLSGSQGANET